MAILKGDVEILGLGNLLQLLSMNRREGLLTLTRGSDRKTIHFAPGSIRLLSSTMKRINKLGKILLRRKRVTQEDMDALLKEQRLLGWKLGQIAVTSGLVKKKDVEDALREQIEEEIFDLFMWSDAAFEFNEGRTLRAETDDPLAGVSFDANLMSLVLEAARRADELSVIRRILHDDDMVLERFGFEIQADELGGDLEPADHVLPMINGRRTVRELVHSSMYPRFATLRAIHRLFVMGYIKAHDKKGQPVRIARPPQRTR
jgi:hypothetical protein